MSGDYGVTRPNKGGCWARVSKSYGAHYQSIDQCCRKARVGKLTCHQHDKFEQAAQQQGEQDK